MIKLVDANGIRLYFNNHEIFNSNVATPFIKLANVRENYRYKNKSVQARHIVEGEYAPDGYKVLDITSSNAVIEFDFYDTSTATLCVEEQQNRLVMKIKSTRQGGLILNYLSSQLEELFVDDKNENGKLLTNFNSCKFSFFEYFKLKSQRNLLSKTSYNPLTVISSRGIKYEYNFEGLVTCDFTMKSISRVIFGCDGVTVTVTIDDSHKNTHIEKLYTFIDKNFK